MNSPREEHSRCSHSTHARLSCIAHSHPRCTTAHPSYIIWLVAQIMDGDIALGQVLPPDMAANIHKRSQHKLKPAPPAPQHPPPVFPPFMWPQLPAPVPAPAPPAPAPASNPGLIEAISTIKKTNVGSAFCTPAEELHLILKLPSIQDLSNVVSFCQLANNGIVDGATLFAFLKQVTA